MLMTLDRVDIPTPNPPDAAKLAKTFARIDAKALSILGDPALIVGPFDACIFCPHRRVLCNGANPLEMPPIRMSIWFAKLAAADGLSQDTVARCSYVSLRTVSRIMSLEPPGDLRLSTVSAISRVLLGNPVDGSAKHPCPQHLIEGAEERRRENQRLLEEINELRQQLEALDDSQRKIDHLKDEVTHLRAQISDLREENAQKTKVITKLLGD